MAGSFSAFEVGGWPFSASCGERLFLSVPDILTDSVAEFDSRDYEHQQFDDLRNVHVWTSVHIVESSLPLSRWEHFACRFSLRYPVIEVPAVRLTRLAAASCGCGIRSVKRREERRGIARFLYARDAANSKIAGQKAKRFGVLPI